MEAQQELTELPRAIIARIIKDALPDGIGVAKDARAAFGTAARVFIAYLTAAANDICIDGNRKTIMANDVIQALEDIDFPEFSAPLTECLQTFKKETSNKKERKAQAKKAEEAANGVAGDKKAVDSIDHEDEKEGEAGEEGDHGGGSEQRRGQARNGEGEREDDGEAPIADEPSED